MLIEPPPDDPPDDSSPLPPLDPFAVIVPLFVYSFAYSTSNPPVPFWAPVLPGFPAPPPVPYPLLYPPAPPTDDPAPAVL